MSLTQKQILEELIDYSMKKGAQGADAILNSGTSFSLSAQKGDIDKYQVSGSQIVGIRVVKDQKVGISYTENLSSEAIKIAADQAITNSEFSDVNEFEEICIKPSEGLDKGEVKLINQEISTQDKIDFTLKLEAEVGKREKSIQSVPYNGFSEGMSETFYLNSLGTYAHDGEAYNSCYTSALVANEKSETSFHYHSSTARNFQELDFEACVNESILHAKAWLGAGQVKTGDYDILFTPDSLASVFGAFSHIYSAKGAWEGTNPFREKLGETIAHPELTIVDTPEYKDAFFKYYFDSEGVLRKDLTLVDKGVFKSFYHNSATAKYFQTTTTGHASRGAKGSLGVGGTNKLVMTGTTAEKEVTAGEYLEIFELAGLHSGMNPSTGDFSAGATGYLCRDGERVESVRGVTVAGNFFTMMKEIACLGDTLHANNSQSFFAPKIRFSQLKVAGK